MFLGRVVLLAPRLAGLRCLLGLGFRFKEAGRFAGLFALFGSFPALFGLGLVFFCVALDRWLSKTGRDDHVVPTIILIIGFAVGYWWQGRVAEGAGLFALQFGVLLVLDRLRI